MTETEPEDVPARGVYVSKQGKLQRIPIPALAKREATAWHYTDTVGLLGIVTKDELWASSPSSLNDSGELDYGAGIIRSSYEQLLRDGAVEADSAHARFLHALTSSDLTAGIHPHVYLLSASRNGDLLNQWQHYAGRGGFAIGIDVTAKLGPRRAAGAGGLDVGDAESGTRENLAWVFPGWYPVVYDREEQARIAGEVLLMLSAPEQREVQKDSSAEVTWTQALAGAEFLLSTLLCTFKHPAFEAEREARYIAAPFESGPYEHFRAAGSRIVPFIGLQKATATADGESRRLPITQVRCGPAPGAAPAAPDVRRLLSANGYPDVVVDTSIVPYR